MKNLVDLIIEQPNAPTIIKEAQTKLEQEQALRKEFYAIIDEDTKAEFVDGEVVYHSPVKKEHNDAAKNLFVLFKAYV